jgi:hypothetical protein
MQPNEPEEDLKGMLGSEGSRASPLDHESERADIFREERDEELDERPDTGWLEGNWVWLVLVAIVVGLVVWVVVIALP